MVNGWSVSLVDRVPERVALRRPAGSLEPVQPLDTGGVRAASYRALPSWAKSHLVDAVGRVLVEVAATFVEILRPGGSSGTGRRRRRARLRRPATSPGRASSARRRSSPPPTGPSRHVGDGRAREAAVVTGHRLLRLHSRYDARPRMPATRSRSKGQLHCVVHRTSHGHRVTDAGQGAAGTMRAPAATGAARATAAVTLRLNRAPVPAPSAVVRGVGARYRGETCPCIAHRPVG